MTRVARPPDPRQVPWPLVAILALAMLVRLAAIFAAPSLNFWDENFQLFEQGHRLAFGYGVITWEFEDGLRSYVLPYALAGVFAASEPIFGGPQGYIHASQIVIAALSLAPVAAVYEMGRRTSRTHAVIAGLAAATWFEIVYFSFRPLTEALAGDFVIVAVALASALPQTISRRRLAAIGFCLALAVLLRVQLAPGVLFVAAWLCRLDMRTRWSALALGAAPVLVLFGVTDWLTWGAPFSSLVRSVWINLGRDKASHFGVQPFYLYPGFMAVFWGPAFPLFIFLAARRLKASAAWIGFSLIVIATHSLIPHKEYRFIFPAIASAVITAAMGSADLVTSAQAHITAARGRLLGAGVAAAWMVVSAALAASPFFTPNWTRDRTVIEASYWLSRRADLCGVAFSGTPWYRTGGYAFLHRSVPMYFFKRRRIAQAEASAQAFNYLFLRRSDLGRFQPDFRPVWCKVDESGVARCLARRPGGCSPEPGMTPIVRMTRLGEGPPETED
jgi:phosphatidylinositol glycan class B